MPAFLFRKNVVYTPSNMNKEQAAILTEIKKQVLDIARKNDWLDLMHFHITKVPKCAEKILALERFKNADKFIVLAGAWLHDIASVSVPFEKYKNDNKFSHSVHDEHHLKGSEIAKDILKDLMPEDSTGQICQCVLRHRNNKEYLVRTDEELVVAIADSMSHFHSVCYLVPHFFFPDDSLEQMVGCSLRKLENDWRDVSIVPEVAELCRKEYEVFKNSLSSYLEG